MAKFNEIYLSTDGLETGSTYITSFTTEINSGSTDNSIPTTKAVYDYALLEVTSEPTLGDYASFSGTFGSIATPVEIVSDNIGTLYNRTYGAEGGYIFDGSRTIAQGVTLWNSNNPSLSITFVTGDDTQVPSLKSTFVMTGGTDTSVGLIEVKDSEYKISADSIIGISIAQSVTLVSHHWDVNFEQTLTVPGVTADNNIIVTPGNDATSISEWLNNSVFAKAQGIDELTFSASSAPIENIVVNILIIK